MDLRKAILIAGGLVWAAPALGADLPLTCRDAAKPAATPALTAELYSRCLAEPGLDEETRANAYYRRGIARQSGGEVMEAATDLREALARRPQWAEAHLARGRAMVTLNESAEARAHFTAALRINPDDVEARLARASLLGRDGDGDAAFADFASVLRTRPVFAQAYFERGLLRAKMKRAEDALDDYAQALTLNPDFADCYRARAELRQAARDYAGAVADLTRALETQHATPWTVLLARGGVHEKMRNRGLAIDDFRQALMLNPKFDPARSALHSMGVSANTAAGN